MSTRFELVTDDHGRVSFSLVDSDGDVLLQGLPCRGKIAAQTEVMHTRDSLRGPDQLIPHEDESGNHFVVLKDDEGSVLGRSRHVAEAELRGLVDQICTAGPGAAIIDYT